MEEFDEGELGVRSQESETDNSRWLRPKYKSGEGGSTMTAIADDRETDSPKSRAGIGRRLVAVTLGVTAATYCAAGPWLVPDNCRWIAWICAALFIPVGIIVAFLGVRGRAADLEAFSARNFAGEFVNALLTAVW